MKDYVSSVALGEETESPEKDKGVFGSDENEYSFEGFKIVINKKVTLTPVVSSKKTSPENG